MKIALISDTHGVFRPEWKNTFRKCDMVIHAGDFTSERIYDSFNELGVPFYCVRGNCDYGKEFAEYLHDFIAVPAAGRLIYVAHCRYDIPGDITDADFIVTGHTHYHEHYDQFGKIFINPGSAGNDRGDGKHFALLTLNDDGSYAVEFVDS